MPRRRIYPRKNDRGVIRRLTAGEGLWEMRPGRAMARPADRPGTGPGFLYEETAGAPLLHPPPIILRITATTPPARERSPSRAGAPRGRSQPARPPAPGAGPRSPRPAPPSATANQTSDCSRSDLVTHRISIRRSGSVMLLSTNVIPGWCSIFTGRPVVRLSMITTSRSHGKGAIGVSSIQNRHAFNAEWRSGK